jgi:hypothetical protein
VAPLFSDQTRIVELGDEVVQIMVGFQDNISAMPAIAAAWPAFGAIGFPEERHTTLAAMPCFGIDFNFIDKHDYKKKKARRARLACVVEIELILGSCHFRRGGGFGQNIHPFAEFVEKHLAIDQRVERPIATSADIFAGHKFGADLADQDTAGGHSLAAVTFDPASFAYAIATVSGTALPFLMCHTKP